jgi:oleandomycin transport system ATP-binding protein
VSVPSGIVVVMKTRLTDTGGVAAVEVRGLVKHYGETKALDGVDLDVRQGTVLGVLGPNGAGKTTLVRVLSTLVRPDAGSARVAGFDVLAQPRQLRRVIGLTGQYASVDEKLSGRENLYMIGRLLDLSRKDARARADELLERFSLTEAAKRPAMHYSGGMRRRLDLAASMIGRPAVLYLDEPTTGLDPRTRNEVWEEVQSMVSDGATVLLTTQYMEEAEKLAHELTVIDRGRVIANGRVEELKAKVGGRTLRIRPSDPSAVTAMAAALSEGVLGGVSGAQADPAEGVVLVPILSDEQLTAVVGLLAARGFGIAGIGTHLPSLDEVFLAITGQKATRAPAAGADGTPDGPSGGPTGGPSDGTPDGMTDGMTDDTAKDSEEMEVAV